MKQQNDHEERPEIYRQLQGKFQMQPEQMQRLAARLNIRASAAAPAEEPVRRPETMPAASQNADTAEETPIRQHKTFGGYWFAARALPLAACLTLAVAGAFWLHGSFRQQENVLDAGSSDVLDYVAEQTAPALTAETSVTTAGTTVTAAQTTSSGTVAQTEITRTETVRTEPVTQTAAAQTDPVQTEDQQGAVTEIRPQTQAPAEQTAKPVTTAAPVTTAVQTTVTQTQTEAVTQQPAEPEIPDDVNIYMADCTGRAGETVEIPVIFAKETSFAGIQCEYQFIPQNGTVPEITDADTDITGSTLHCIENLVILAYGESEKQTFSGGVRVMLLTVQIPKDAPAGTVWTMENIKTILADKETKHLPVSVKLGALTVTEN